jgi:hypothetical protein
MIKLYQQTVSNCAECPNVAYLGDRGRGCGLMYGAVNSFAIADEHLCPPEGIPEFCHLEDGVS